MSLKSYRQMRNFKMTSEPKGKVRSKKSNLYVIQKHAASHLHYDFRLELEGVLKSWAVPKGPSLDPKVKRLAVQMEDHPLDYGDFEGGIPKGQYGGGTVMLWDKGGWSYDKTTDIKKSYQKGHLTFQLKGKKLKGLWQLIRVKSDPKNWLLIKIDDQYAKNADEYDIIQKKTKSVKSNKTMEQLAKQYSSSKLTKNIDKLSKKTHISKTTRVDKKSKMPLIVKPQLATLVDKPPNDKNWLHEIKFDGYRLIAFIKDKKIRLMTRANQNWTTKFANIVAALEELDLADCIIDGEIVVLDENQRSDFQLLQNSLKNPKNKPFIYYVFDLIYYNGYDLSSLPLIERKKILQKIINNNDGCIRFSAHVTGSGDEVFAKSCQLLLEGLVSKEIHSKYIQKRTKSWLKTKCIKRQEFVICGYTLPSGSRKYFGSLILGVYSKNKTLTYCGHVGTGFNHALLYDVFSELQKIKTTEMPFEYRPSKRKKIIWVKPKLVAEVEFTEWTSDHLLRHPSFKGLRKDKSAREIHLEEVKKLPQSKKYVSASLSTKSHDEKLSNPNKILYPKNQITKAQLWEYYKAVHKWILPYVTNRPLTLVRCPEGQDKKCFYQKHFLKSMSSDVKTISIKEKNKPSDYIYIDNLSGLLSLPQLGVLEIHTWGSDVNDIDYPNRLVFDIDPSPEIKWKAIVQTAFEIRDQLLKLKLKSFVKITGGKGLHVVVPIQPEFAWDDIKLFCRTFVEYLVKLNPHKYTANMSKSKRAGKIYIDYLRNQRGATSIAPYSTRKNAEATVAMPVDWKELTARKEDTTFTILSALTRLKKIKNDPWKAFFKIKQSLNLDKL